MSAKLKTYATYGMPFLSAALLLFVLHSISPLQFGPVGILFILVLIYIVTASLFYTLVTLIFNIMGRLHRERALTTRSRKLTYYVVSVISLAPVFLLALNSLGQLQLSDFILVALLIGVACFYVVRRVGR